MTDEKIIRRCRCCGMQIHFGHLACRNHWYVLPRPLREAILTTYRAGNKHAYVANVRSAEQVWREIGCWKDDSNDSAT